MDFQAVLNMSPDELAAWLMGAGATMLIWFLAVSVVLSLPPIFVLFSKRTHGGAKFGWFIITSLFSWLGYAVFLIMTQPPKQAAAGQKAE